MTLSETTLLFRRPSNEWGGVGVTFFRITQIANKCFKISIFLVSLSLMMVDNLKVTNGSQTGTDMPVCYSIE